MKLPPLVVKDTSQNLLFTWVDEQGDFHVVQKTQDVPEANRKRVRVVDTRRSEGTQEWVYVADLTQKKPDGSYAMSALPRGKWDEIGAKRRKTRLEALAPSAAPAPPAANGSPPTPGNAQLGVNLSAIVYGADWCKPCHAAEAYLKKRGVKVIMKDIDNSAAARAEMQHKLTRAGMGGAQIPIIDVMGQLLVGYSPSALDRAIQTARQSKTL
jgi:glutaredoxin